MYKSTKKKEANRRFSPDKKRRGLSPDKKRRGLSPDKKRRGLSQMETAIWAWIINSGGDQASNFLNQTST
jgi:hypothetical protein